MTNAEEPTEADTAAAYAALEERAKRLTEVTLEDRVYSLKSNLKDNARNVALIGLGALSIGTGLWNLSITNNRYDELEGVRTVPTYIDNTLEVREMTLEHGAPFTIGDTVFEVIGAGIRNTEHTPYLEEKLPELEAELETIQQISRVVPPEQTVEELEEFSSHVAIAGRPDSHGRQFGLGSIGFALGTVAALFGAYRISKNQTDYNKDKKADRAEILANLKHFRKGPTETTANIVRYIDGLSDAGVPPERAARRLDYLADFKERKWTGGQHETVFEPMARELANDPSKYSTHEKLSTLILDITEGHPTPPGNT